ncbi:MAG: sulfurtransferase-like selenium metabolism protein YedF [Dehalococcoidales bacterium]|nr:sulfurtransferase-like selenium metabolism protein YedF [Dehalococcoidales bacterium]
MSEIDARGLPCPQPVIKTKKALEEIETGQVTVLVDSPESRENVRRFAQSQGCQVAVREEAGVVFLDITKGTSCQAVPKQSGDVVLITSDRLGVGEERLGEILMHAFLNTLWDYTPKPAKLLFINNGVRLTTEGSEVLETLKLLEKEGVQVFSCGTCLEYYKLKDKLGVGAVSDMYATVDALLAAEKVIRV